MPRKKNGAAHPAKQLIPVVVKSVRANLQRGYDDKRTAGLRLEAAKHDIWRLLIVIGRLQLENEQLGKDSDRLFDQVSVD